MVLLILWLVKGLMDSSMDYFLICIALLFQAIYIRHTCSGLLLMKHHVKM